MCLPEGYPTPFHSYTENRTSPQSLASCSMPVRTASKIAATDSGASTVTLQVPLPVQAPPQPPKAEVPVSAAVRVTDVPGGKLAVQVPMLPVAQLSPPELLVTVPAALPCTLTVRMKRHVVATTSNTPTSPTPVAPPEDARDDGGER